MKKTLIRAISFCLTLCLLTGLLAPLAGAVEYEGIEPITVNATAALLVDLDTDQVLLEQSADETRYPASITKIMTALLTLEAVGRGELSLDTVVTVPAEALTDITEDSSTANLVAGEEITVKNLLYCLLLPSANEAANTLAITVAGDVPTFVEQMNQRAAELGMENTHFANPHGLHNPDHYTTAKDIYKMSKEAMSHPSFREIVSTGQYTVPATNKSEARVLYNTNGLLARYKYYGYEYSGTIGIKTGSTPEAGYCLVTAAKKKGHTLVSVVLGCQNPTDANGKVQRLQFTESRRLLDWGFDNFSSATLLNADTYLEEVPVKYSSQASHVVLKPAQSVTTLIPGAYDEEKLDLRLTLTSATAKAPISKGDVLGSVAVIYGGEQYATVDMVAVSDIALSPFLAFIDSVNAVLGNFFVRLVLALALIFFAVGVVRRLRDQQAQTRKEARLQRQEEKKQEAIARQQREEAAYAQKMQEQERRRQEKDLQRQEEQERRRHEQELRRQEQEQRRQEHQRQREEEARRREQEHELRRQEKERQRQEQARRREQERQQREQERRRQEQERQRQEQERRRQEQERRRREAEYRRQEQEYRRQQERQRREAEYRRQEQERQRREQERRWQEQQHQLWEQERRRQEQERRRREQAYREDYRNSAPSSKGRDHRPNNRR